MNYTCPKCGKNMDLSTEVLINSDYKVICPQCLCQLHIVGDFAYIPNDTLELDTTIKPSRTINCPKCGHEASTGAHFCPNCGCSFDAPASSTGAVDIVPEEVTVLPPPLPGSDPLYQDALKFLAHCHAITPMMLRDHFRISLERASELIRQLEEGGAVGPYNNGGPRQILIPHTRLYDRPQFQSTTQQGNTQQQNRPRRGSIGCVTWFLIIAIFIMFTRACTG